MQKFEIQLDKIGKAQAANTNLKGIVPNALEGTANSSIESKRVGITTLGCKVNTFESELIGEALQADDWLLVDHKETADLYLINTCTVTNEADRQARQEVRKAVKRNPEALIVVTGCYAQMDSAACAAIPGVDLVLGNDKKLDIHQLMPLLQQGKLPKVMVGNLNEHVSLPDKLLAGFETHTRAFVQIQQGCDQGCTFCVIHVARGPSRSLPASLIKRQVQRLALNGYPEVVICGVDLGSYGQDFESISETFDLVDLLQELLALEYDPNNPFRIRLSSLDPHHLSDRLIDMIANEPRLCPHIHLSMQSGNTLILKRMKRRYSAEQMQQRISALRKVLPDLVISADVMVGFPTETEQQFQDTEAMVKELGIAFPHVFSYSARAGTPAARIPELKQIPITERKRRNQRVRAVGAQVKKQLMEDVLGKEVWVLPEKIMPSSSRYGGLMHCRAENYLPVLVDSKNLQIGQWLKVALIEIAEEYMLARSG